MATFFGEVIIPSSRVFFDDFDEEYDESQNSDQNKPHLFLKKYHDLGPSDYDTLILCDGAVAKGFTDTYMLNISSKLIAEIEIEKDDEKDSYDVLVLKPKKVPATKLYLLSNNCLLLQISESIPIGLANHLILLVAPWLENCKNVISLVSRHIANYRCDSLNELPAAFVRGLATSNHALPSHLKCLEQPNFISCVPASVMAWCEAQKIAALLAVLYSDQETLEELTVKPLLKTFADSGLSYLLLNQPSVIYNDSLKDMDKTFMYM